MASQDFDATRTPADIVAGLSLSQNVAYTVQNVSGTATLFLRQATAAAISDRAHRIESSGYMTIRPNGEPIWLWTDDPNGCPTIATEAA